MDEKKGPKAFKRHIFDDVGKKLLIESLELMKEAVGNLDTVCEYHLVEDWMITYEGETKEEREKREAWLRGKELEQMRRFHTWIKVNYPEIKEEWSSNVATRG